MPKQTIEIKVDVPPGWNVIDIDYAEQHDYYIEYGTVRQWSPANQSGCVYAIVERAEAWRPATVDDVIRSLQGESVKARFRDRNDADWTDTVLCGFVKHTNTLYPWVSTVSHWKFCEVLSKEAASE